MSPPTSNPADDIGDDYITTTTPSVYPPRQTEGVVSYQGLPINIKVVDSVTPQSNQASLDRLSLGVWVI
jgi:hypothetical protein